MSHALVVALTNMLGLGLAEAAIGVLVVVLTSGSVRWLGCGWVVAGGLTSMFAIVVWATAS